MQSALAGSAGILAAVAGVDRHNHRVVAGGQRIAWTRGGVGIADRRHLVGVERVRGGSARRRRGRGRNRRGAADRLLALNSEHHVVAAAVALGHRAGFARLRQLEHQPNALLILWRAGANTPDNIFAAEVKRQPLNHAALTNIQHHAIGVAQRKEAVHRLSGEAQGYRRLAVTVFDFDIREASRQRGRCRQTEYQQQRAFHPCDHACATCSVRSSPSAECASRRASRAAPT